MTMDNQDAQTAEPGKVNPHYGPPLMRWNRVEIVGVRGLEFGIITDAGGTLTLAVRMGGGKWRDGHHPDPATCISLADPDFVFQVFNHDRGPAVGHEFDPGPDGKCRGCIGVAPP